MSYTPIRSEIELFSEPPSSNIITLSERVQNATKSRIPGRGKAAGLRRHTVNKPRYFPNYPIIAHSHLCWDWVWQRPQQFLSRLSRNRKVLFVETIGPDSQLAMPVVRYRHPHGFPNLTVLQLQFPARKWQDGAFIDGERRRLVKEFLKDVMPGQFDNAVQWFYDPMAVSAFMGQMGEILTVYDCMDELSKFRGAPANIIERETQLLEKADVVFTGGRKLLESKSRHNDNCHFYGCGVDCAHFGSAREEITQVPADLANLGKPALGYFGVVDERMDYELIDQLAAQNPQWSIVMLGPTMKVDESQLPRRANLHWLGKKDYRDLPAYCKGLDLCLMPFALNESTEYINPTKALEYMATGRQIISTPVPDVVSNFGSVVKIGRGADEFIKLCHTALEHPDNAAIRAGLQMASQNSWDSIVAQLENHMEEALAKVRIAGIIA
jgi:glycosyltransferase involved in cell wall biosynthesis